MIGSLILIIYIIISIVDVYSLQKRNKKVEFLTKPLLMPLLILYYIFQLNLIGIDSLIVLALIGGWLGDIFLMWENDEKKFMLGMVSFLLGHIFYIISFLIGIGSNFLAFPIWGLLLILPIVINLVLTFPKFKNHLGDFKIPVFVYMIVIIIMHFTAILRLAVLEFFNPSFYLVWLGSMLFIVSDSLIAIRAFNKEFDYPGKAILAMITYILAQYFIVQGLII